MWRQRIEKSEKEMKFLPHCRTLAYFDEFLMGRILSALLTVLSS